jgi:hypothetical protein
MGKPNEFYTRARSASRKRLSLSLESENVSFQPKNAGTAKVEPARSIQGPSLRRNLGNIEPSRVDSKRDSPEQRPNKIDPSHFKDFLESFSQTLDQPGDGIGQGDAEIKRTRGLKKPFSGLLQRRSSLSSLYSSSSLAPSKSLTSISNIWGTLLYGNKPDRGETLKDDEVSLMASKTSNRMAQLHQNSVTTHDLSEEDSSSSGV